MTELISQLKLSIQLERIRQCIKTSGDLAKQMQAKSIPSAKCNSFIAQEMHKDFEIWEAAQLAADKALEDLVAVAEALRTLVAPVVTAEAPPDTKCERCGQLITLERGEWRTTEWPKGFTTCNTLARSKHVPAPTITAEDVIPDFICTACKEPAPCTINGICWDCDDAIQQAKSIEPCDGPCCAGTVVQMKRRGK